MKIWQSHQMLKPTRDLCNFGIHQQEKKKKKKVILTVCIRDEGDWKHIFCPPVYIMAGCKTGRKLCENTGADGFETPLQSH